MAAISGYVSSMSRWTGRGRPLAVHGAWRCVRGATLATVSAQNTITTRGIHDDNADTDLYQLRPDRRTAGTARASAHGARAGGAVRPRSRREDRSAAPETGGGVSSSAG